MAVSTQYELVKHTSTKVRLEFGIEEVRTLKRGLERGSQASDRQQDETLRLALLEQFVFLEGALIQAGE